MNATRLLAEADEFSAYIEDNGMVSIVDGEGNVRLTMDGDTWEKFTGDAVARRAMI